MSLSLSPEQLTEIRDLAARGQMIDAIKRCREITGADLVAAKEAVERIASGSAPDVAEGQFAPLPGLEGVSEHQLGDVRRMLAAGNKIGAIKEYRALTGLGLAEAKEAVERMQDQAAGGGVPGSGQLPTNTANKSGCFGTLVACISLGGILWAFAS